MRCPERVTDSDSPARSALLWLGLAWSGLVLTLAWLGSGQPHIDLRFLLLLLLACNEALSKHFLPWPKVRMRNA